METKKGNLFLEDGSFFLGQLYGFEGPVSGEVVFSTGMTGYPQSLTDPSYAGQILTFTYPLIGNYGVPKPIYHCGILNNFESEKIQIRALVVSSVIEDKSHWLAKKTLTSWLKANKIVCLSGVDTRTLTQKLREKGTMLGKISKFQSGGWRTNLKLLFESQNLVAKVSCPKPIIYKNGSKKILLIDCGVKMSIIRSLYDLGLSIKRVPWNYNQETPDFDGMVISNGPGDPKLLPETIQFIKRIMVKKIPILGICLGSQLLALAAGGDTYKLKYGHRSLNQPVLLSGTKKAFISSQNHGYAVRKESLSSEWQEWFINLNDGTNEGIKHKRLPFLAVQFHPEGNPGPKDTSFVFDEFIKLLFKH